jgi:hypothetical protein
MPEITCSHWQIKLPKPAVSREFCTINNLDTRKCQLSILKDFNLPMALPRLPYRTEFYNGDRHVVCLLRRQQKVVCRCWRPWKSYTICILQCNCANLTLASVWQRFQINLSFIWHHSFSFRPPNPANHVMHFNDLQMEGRHMSIMVM